MDFRISCQERDELLRRYSSATREYSVLVTELTAKTPVIGREKYLGLRTRADAARIRSEETRVEYERHVAKHGCREPPSVIAADA